MSEIVPKSRPQMKVDEVRSLIAGKEGAEAQVVIVGMRAYYKHTMGDPDRNDVGIYDDAIFLLYPGGMLPCNANTDPSRMHPGVAVLKPGTHWYKKGLHGISKGPGKAYPAFRPASADEGVPVTRDGKDSRGIAINIHKGGWGTTSSEGCQTVYPSEWEEFQHKGYAEMDRCKQVRVPYILIEL